MKTKTTWADTLAGAGSVAEQLLRADTGVLKSYDTDTAVALRRVASLYVKLATRIEALQAGDDRSCPVCGKPVGGRSDAVYCGSDCRVKAFRSRHKGDPGQIPTDVVSMLRRLGYRGDLADLTEDQRAAYAAEALLKGMLVA